MDQDQQRDAYLGAPALQRLAFLLADGDEGEAVRVTMRPELAEALTASHHAAPDEHESETGAREVYQAAQALATQAPLAGTVAVADLVGRLAACVASYIEDTERRLDTHEASNAADVTRLAALEDQVGGARADSVAHRLRRLEENERTVVAPEVETRDATWTEAYDQGYEAARVGVDEMIGQAHARGREEGLRAAGNIMAAAIEDARKGNADLYHLLDNPPQV